jgi:hypothetical protein
MKTPSNRPNAPTRGAAPCRAFVTALAPSEKKSLIWINDRTEQKAKV